MVWSVLGGRQGATVALDASGLTNPQTGLNIELIIEHQLNAMYGGVSKLAEREL
jgi:hypothetical protein